MASTDFNANLGRQQFLQLMVSQLQYQNPLEPVNQQDFLGQLAQFSVLDGVESLNVRFADMLKLQTLSQGTSLVGKTISYRDGSGAIVTGEVREARVVDGALSLTVDNSTVSLDDVISIVTPHAAP
ncbi:flagellar hook capping FlgD N-terminal domain-containing protein [Planctomicrobium sp. SH664]|uniref:flagellar hook capping FlgD N-terminal domain-containing protein n=1 Tax=Planctomicrobium sp. SH664 TaxID=3448125 RepID=UPI003F5B0683